MARYSDADKLLEKLFPYGGIDKKTYSINAYAIYDAIQKSLIADVAEVVRCKDCVKRNTPDCAMYYKCSVCGGQWSWENDNGFCSFGERREAE